MANVAIFGAVIPKIKISQSWLTQLNSLQVFQLMRYGTLFLNSVLMSNFLTHVEDVSAYETLFLYGATFYTFWLSGINATLFPQKAIHGRKIYFNAFLVLVVLSVISGVVMALYSQTDATVPDKQLMQRYAIYTLVNAPTYLTEFLLILEAQYLHVLVYAAIIFLLQIACNVVPTLLGFDLFVVVDALLALSVAKLIYLLFLLKRYAEGRFNADITRQLLRKSAPMMLSLLFSGSLDFINGSLIRHYLGSLEFTRYRLGAREFPVFLIMTNTLSNVMSGEIAGHHAREDLAMGLQALKEKTGKLMNYLFPAAMIMMLASKTVFSMLYFNKPQFVDAYLIFNILLLLLVSRFIFPQTVLIGMHKNHYMAYASLLEWVSIIGCSLLLINTFGITGVALATVLGFYIEKITLFAFCKKEGVLLHQYLPVREWVMYSLVLWGIFIFLYFFPL